MKVNSLEARLIVFVARSVSLVLSVRGEANIGPTVIQPIPVSVVYFNAHWSIKNEAVHLFS
jgi:hypothetical protein